MKTLGRAALGGNGAESLSRSAPKPATPTRAVAKVLVVDDDPMILRTFRAVLERGAGTRKVGAAAPESIPMSLDVTTARSGEEALRLLERRLGGDQRFELAFVDFTMEGLDGLETVQRLWARDPRLEVVICTGAPNQVIASPIWQEAGGDLLVLKKPCLPLEIFQLAQVLVEKRRLRLASDQRLLEMELKSVESSRHLEVVNDRLLRETQEREKMELELRHAQKLEAVGQLAAGIAHEINTPVQFIGDSVCFLRESFEDLLSVVDKLRSTVHALAPQVSNGAQIEQELMEFLERADLEFVEEECPRAFERTEEGVTRVAGIVRAMKEFSHPDRGDQSLADLNRALTNTSVVARNEFKYVANLEMELGAIPPVKCTLGDLNQVFLNLIVNAAHAIADAEQEGGELGTIRVETASRDGWVTVAISDTGTGIDASVQSRIFDPFFTTKEVGKGTGQGLAIAHNIVTERHGGRLRFETARGKGTTFFVELPVDGISTSDEEGGE